MPTITDNNELILDQSTAVFASMMAFLQAIMQDNTPYLRRYGGYVYFLPNKSQQDRWDQLIDTRPDDAFALATFIFKEGTDKYIQISLASGYQNIVLVGSTGNELVFSFSTKDGNMTTNEPVTVTYTFECSGRTQVVQEQYGAGEEVHFCIDDYLLEGRNTITITVRGNNSKVSASETVTYTYQELDLTSDFNTATPIGVGYNLSCNVTAKGQSDGGKAVTVEWCIDREGSNSALAGEMQIDEAVDGSNTKRLSIAADALPQTPGKHTLQMRLRAVVGGVTRYSQVWYYEWMRTGKAGQYVTIKRKLSGTDFVSGFELTVECERYVTEQIYYGFHSSEQGTRYNLRWLLMPQQGGDSTSVGSAELGGDVTGTEGRERVIEFTPVETGIYRLTAVMGSATVADYALRIEANSSGLEEASITDMAVRLFANGRRNDEPVADRSVWKYKTVECQFDGVEWDGKTGWVDNAMQLQGTATMTVPVRPFLDMTSGANGVYVEVEYETFGCTDTDAVVARCGNRILIKGDSCQLSNGRVFIKDRYPVGNRQKMGFNIHAKSSSTQPKLMEIINNGVTSACAGYLDSDSFYATDYLQFGGTDKCGIRIYAIRVYVISLTNKQALNNTIVDSTNISQMVRDNDIYDGSAVNVENLKNRIACLKLVGRGGTDNLNTIWNSQKKQLVHMDAEWTNPEQPDTNWRCEDMRVRSHGQSTLQNPLKSLKIWMKNESGQSTHLTKFFFPATADEPMADPRWSMKRRSMPQNKFVMQCYYIDSSNVKSPVLMQLIDSAMRGAGIYTAPMQYAYGRDGKCYYNDMKQRFPDDPKCWEFPYELRYTPDSIPCILTTQDSPSEPEKLVGIFVLMDDKKSDYLYGERSIYACPYDPFCFDHDKDMYECLWNNADITRFEFLSNKHPVVTFTDISSFFMPPGDFDHDDDDIVTDIEGGESATGNTDAEYAFEQAVEIIYPDIDDLKGKKSWPRNYLPDNMSNPAASTNIDTAHAARLWQFHKWVYDCYVAWRDGDGYAKFRAEAADHMDLVQWAAYYCFMLPNGAFDNLVRNMQLTTFHRNAKGYFVWLPMDWDNDILYGTTNTGPYEFDPPVTRQTTNAQNEYAFRGEDCWLWDALEAWPVFLTSCRDTMDALNAHGYTYANIIAQQEVFSAAWPKALYNESQNVKYKQMYLSNPASNARFLYYLLGDGTTLRRWWIKKNYDYWMARLAAGDFAKNGVSVRWNGSAGDVLPTITLTYAEDSFFGWSSDGKLQIVEGGGYSREVKPGEVVQFKPLDISNSIYCNVFSAPYIKTADYSELAYRLGIANLNFFADDVTGTNLQELKIGVRDADLAKGFANNNPNVLVGLGYLTEVRELQIQGYTLGESIDLSAMKYLTHLYAKGSAYSNISLAASVRLAVAELPTSLSTITWEYVTFGQLTFHGAGRDYATTSTYPTALLTATLIGMGEDESIRRMVLDWLRARQGTDGLRLTLTGLAWDGLDYDDVLLMAEAFGEPLNRNYQGKVRITTVHGEERILNTAEMNRLVELYNDPDRGVNVFSTESAFQIDCSAGFILTGNQSILAGNSGQIVAAVFPLTAGGYTFYYEILKINGEDRPSSVGTVNGWQTYRNFSLNVFTGEIRTSETADATTSFTIFCTASSATMPTQTGVFDTEVRKRTYPERLSIGCERTIAYSGDYPITIDYLPPRDANYGTLEAFRWEFADTDDIHLIGQRSGYALLQITDFSEDQELTIGYSETYRDGVTRRAEPVILSLVYNANEGILFDVTNHYVLVIFRDYGLSVPDYALSSPVQMTRLEAQRYTELPPAFQDDAQASRITHFDEIRHFKRLEHADLSHTRVGGELDFTALTRCEEINLETTAASVRF